mmetsp:Transcript_16986/g.53545  ORF Transcript_16986/g.53545 Transcript_16986/m.53545 type:complete len:228 (-) Transcript_16986:1250-1933(-)
MRTPGSTLACKASQRRAQCWWSGWAAARRSCRPWMCVPRSAALRRRCPGPRPHTASSSSSATSGRGRPPSSMPWRRWTAGSRATSPSAPPRSPWVRSSASTSRSSSCPRRTAALARASARRLPRPLTQSSRSWASTPSLAATAMSAGGPGPWSRSWCRTRAPSATRPRYLRSWRSAAPWCACPRRRSRPSPASAAWASASWRRLGAALPSGCPSGPPCVHAGRRLAV